MRLTLPLAVLCLLAPLGAQSVPQTTPLTYSAAGIVNAATGVAGSLSPNSIATIYGTDLSYDTEQAGAGTIVDSTLPTELAGVHVIVEGLTAPLYYVCPTQINFLVPSELLAGNVTLVVTRDGTAGPELPLTLQDVSPGFFQWGPGKIAATHANGSVINETSPARPGEVVVLYGTGLGRTDPPAISGQMSTVAAQIADRADLQVLVNGTAVDPTGIRYAGISPGTPGLYQINLKLPAEITPDPEIRVKIGGEISPASMTLPAH